MILLPTGKLIISYTPYVHTEGGFCITINSDSEIKMESLDLTEKEKSELFIFKVNKNKTPKYADLIEEYFDNLETKII